MEALETRNIFVNDNAYQGTNALEDVSWSPDSQWLLFRIFDGESSMGAYRVRPDGSDLLRLFPEDGYDSEPAWQPGVSSEMP